MIMRFIITTGGTGGHIFPALALCDEIKKNLPQASILFIGANYGMEKELCKKRNIPFLGLEVEGFIGRGVKSLKALFLLFKAYFQAKKILKSNKIDIVVGFGGYASAPSILAAKSLKIPIFLAEQNAFPGSVNRYFASFAEKILLSIPIKKGIYSSENEQKCIITGNPVRNEIVEASKDISNINLRSSKKLLILGGSLGAQSINSIIGSLLEDLHKEDIEIVHQCGKKDYERMCKIYEDSPYSSSCVQAFIDDMSTAYKNADFVIARAGASTIAELACMKKACLFIPFPFAAHNHQYYNAKTLEEKNACLLIEESSIFHENKVKNKELVLNSILEVFHKDNTKKEELKQNIATFAKPNAAKEMYDCILNTFIEIVEKSRKKG